MANLRFNNSLSESDAVSLTARNPEEYPDPAINQHVLCVTTGTNPKIVWKGQVVGNGGSGGGVTPAEVVGLLMSTTIQGLDTTNKTVVGAINEVAGTVMPLKFDPSTAQTQKVKIGSSINYSAAFSVKKGSSDVTTREDIVVSVISSSGSLAGATISTANKTITKSSVSSNGNIQLKAQRVVDDGVVETVDGPVYSVAFYYYKYEGQLDSDPGAITESIVKALSSAELTNTTTKALTQLPANKYYLFSVASSYITGKVLEADNSAGAKITGARTGTVTVDGVNYSYILVPASTASYEFKIVNV